MMWSNTSDLEGALRDAGLGEWAPKLAQLARHSIILIPGPLDEGANAPSGACRLGGAPDMPPNADWPSRPPFSGKQSIHAGPLPGRVLLGPHHWVHRLFRTQRWRQALAGWERSRQAERDVRSRAWPLSFVAQIDFAELHGVHALDGFPSTGRLLLFCDPANWPWGERDNQAGVRAVFTELPAESLERRRSPPEFETPEAKQFMPRGFVFKPRALRPAAWLLPPPWGSRELLRLQAEAPGAWAHQADASSGYHRFWKHLFAREPHTFGPTGDAIHQVGGWAFSIQEPVEAECARFAGDPGVEADNWQLVLQIDSDIEAGMEWGDVGRLYLCARKSDLAATRFDRSWMVMQCY